MGSIEAVVDIPALRAQLADLEAEASAPNLWDDQEHAQQVTSRLSFAQGEIRRVEGLRSRLDDLPILFELAEDEGDEAALADAMRELELLETQIAELEVRTLLSGEYDAREAFVTLRSGAGGVDAADWAEMLLRMYTRYCERHGWPYEVNDTSYAEEAGIKSATFHVKVPYAYGTLSVEQGTHRLVRISPFDNQGRRQTSFAEVEVIPVVEQTDHVDVPEDELRVDVYRASGPGGQGVNTTDSAVRITHIPTGIVVSQQDQRSQIQNKAKAMEVLRSRILDHRLSQIQADRARMRKTQVGTGDRSAKIRTYNFPQSRVTDHRINLTLHDISRVVDGDIGKLVDALRVADTEEKLSGDSPGE